MTDETAAVLAANDAFYSAFATGDAAAMDVLWAREAPVTCDHPGADPLEGRDAVMDSWRDILAGGGAPGIHAEDPAAEIEPGGSTAVVRCRECIEDAALDAVNTFVREDGAWRMTGHRACF
jgi:hypothetical protein